MMSLRSRHLRWQVVLTGLTAWLLGSCQPSVPVWGPAFPDIEGHGSTCDGCGGKKPKKELTICDIAHEIDELEEHIEKYGSVVPKHADIWGQARLTMHRQEFERVMRADVYNFHPTIQATISARDQAFLANALSLSAGAKVASAPSASETMSLLSGINDPVTRDSLVRTTNISNYVTADGKLAIEPTILEDQKKRYIDHLHQLRRINEGDDNTDAPGYALNLVRIPISILAGSCTQTGYGAECTITATPHLSDNLLPETFRNLVENDLVGLLTLPLTRIIELEDESELQNALTAFEQTDNPQGASGIPFASVGEALYTKVKLYKENNLPTTDTDYNFIHKRFALYTRLLKVFVSNAPTSTKRVNETPIPTSQMASAFGANYIGHLALQVKRLIKDHFACKGAPYHLDVQAALKNELTGAYSFLGSPSSKHLWQYCTPALAAAVRNQDNLTIIRIQQAFVQDVLHLTETYFTNADIRLDHSITSILAWMILVDSALLTERFLDDMKANQAAKGCPCPPPEEGLPLYLPSPPAEVCQMFNDYVRCRWPLHIFALDPETEDQNVGDSFSLRRELQLAMSVAFTSGQMSANNFTRYVRRIEQDIDTISINRTIIGFSHGDDTFGWRFYPRVQTPPIDGNLQALFRDLLIGGYGPRYALRRRRLENGIRECVALVIMPSFVPFLDLEVTGNWFRLANPKCKALDLKQTMRLSAAVKSLQDFSCQTCDQHCYRPGDIELMMRRLDQLSLRLPLQKQLVNVPYENTHGGFQLLSVGVTNLAPELNGWYGAPGINPNGETSIYLVGDNFSVDQTRVIVGGMLLDPNCEVKCSKDRPAADCVCCGLPPLPAPPSASEKHPVKSAKPEPEKLPEPPPMPEKMTFSPSQKSNTTSVSGKDVDPEVQQVIFRRCRPQQTRPPAAPIISLLNAPTPGMPPGMQAASAGLLAATAGAQAALAGMHANIANSGLGGVTAAGNQPRVGIFQTMGAAGTADPKAPPASQGGDAANKGAKSAVDGADAANKGAQTVAATASTLATDLTTAATTLAYGVPHFQMELLSRQIMRIVIPAGVYSNNGWVDVHIATPYGVSPHLAIPILCDGPLCACKLAPFAGTLEDTSTDKNRIVEVNQEKGNTVKFSDVQKQHLNRLRIHLPGIESQQQVVTLRIRFKGFDANTESIDVDFKLYTGGLFLYEPRDIGDFSNKFEDVIKRHFREKNAPAMPKEISTERLTVYFKDGPCKSSSEIDLTGSFKILLLNPNK